MAQRRRDRLWKHAGPAMAALLITSSSSMAFPEELENARSLVYYAAGALDTESEDRQIAAAMTKAYASDACVKVVADAKNAPDPEPDDDEDDDFDDDDAGGSEDRRLGLN